MRLRKPPRRLFRPRRPPGAVAGLALGRAMATWGRDEPSGSILAVVARIGDARHVAPGYTTADCDSCGKPVWLSPQVRAMGDRLNLKIVCTCTRCMGSSGCND
jgi:hypothetical protein